MLGTPDILAYHVRSVDATLGQGCSALGVASKTLGSLSSARTGMWDERHELADTSLLMPGDQLLRGHLELSTIRHGPQAVLACVAISQ